MIAEFTGVPRQRPPPDCPVKSEEPLKVWKAIKKYGKVVPITLLKAFDSSLLSDQVFATLRQQILAGEYEPGTRLVESELARKFEISQAPVREGLRKLAHAGLARQISRRGTFVEEVSAKAAIDAFQVRAALEPLAVRELLPVINDDILESLEREMREMLSSARESDVAGLLEHDIAFHRIIWWRSPNELLPKVWPMVEKIWPLLEARVRSTSDATNRLGFADLESVALTHRVLIDALKARDADTPALFYKHVTDVWSQLETLSHSH